MGKTKTGPEKGINIRFPDHIYKRIVDVARREGRSLNAAVIDSIIMYLKNRGYNIDFVEDRTGPDIELTDCAPLIFDEKESRESTG